MDNWNEKQMKMMSLGGNLRLKKHFSEYDLLEEAPSMRYKTRAADYYRRMLRASASGDSILEEPPEKDKGRETIEDVIRTSEENSANSNSVQEEDQDMISSVIN